MGPLWYTHTLMQMQYYNSASVWGTPVSISFTHLIIQSQMDKLE